MKGKFRGGFLERGMLRNGSRLEFNIFVFFFFFFWFLGRCVSGKISLPNNN